LSDAEATRATAPEAIFAETSPERWRFEQVSACPLCEGTGASELLSRRVQGVALRFVRCVPCGFIYQNPRFTPEELARYFSSPAFIKDASDKIDLNDTLGYYDYFAWDHSYRLTARRRLARIRKLLLPRAPEADPARLLEVGTATGSFLAEARAQGYDVRGLDLSTRFAEYASSTYGLPIDNGFVESFDFPRARYDVVCYFGGIACSRDPVRALSNIRNALRPDGILLFNVTVWDSPVGFWKGTRHPEVNHASLVIFTRATIRKVLERAGFELLRSETEWQVASLARIVTYLRSNRAWKVVRALGLASVNIPVLAVGTYLVSCRLAGAAGRKE